MAPLAERPARRRRRWPFLLLMILTAVSLLLHATKYRRGREVRKLQEQYPALVQANPVAGTKARRARFYQARYFLGYPMAASYAATNLIRRMDGIVSPLRLFRVQVDPGLHDLRFELAVGVEAASLEKAQRKFAVFFGKLQLLVGIADASFVIQEQATGGLRVFAVSGRAELQP